MTRYEVPAWWWYAAWMGVRANEKKASLPFTVFADG